jgi:hypothetical protein
MYSDDVGRAADALNDLNCAMIELAETVPGDSEVSRFAGKISRTADAIAAAQAAAVADPAVRAAAERFAAKRTCAAFDDLADLIEPILGIDRTDTIIPGLPETDPRYWTWKHFAEPHGTPRTRTSHEPGR